MVLVLDLTKQTNCLVRFYYLSKTLKFKIV